MSDPLEPTSPEDSEPVIPPKFTKEPQPELPLELRKEKAGWTKNRFMLWIVIGGFAIYLIITGIVGILTKAR